MKNVRVDTADESVIERIRASPRFEALRRWGHIMGCVSNADHYLGKMEVLKFEPTLDNILEVDGLLLAFAVTYGRLFTQAAHGFPKLDRNRVYKSESLRETHDRIMSLRHQRYAHEGGSADIDYSLEIDVAGTRPTLRPRIAFQIPGHEFPLYRVLVDFLQEYTFEQTHRAIRRLNEEFGVDIAFPSGPPPAHRTRAAP